MSCELENHIVSVERIYELIRTEPEVRDQPTKMAVMHGCRISPSGYDARCIYCSLMLVELKQ